MPGPYSSRERLPPLQGCIPKDAYLPPLPLAPRQCLHTALPVFELSEVESLITEASETQGSSSWLPPHLAQTVVKWSRVVDALALPVASEELLWKRDASKREAAAAAEAAAEALAAAEAAAAADPKKKGKKPDPKAAAAPAVVEEAVVEEKPVEWSESDVGEDDRLLPHVFVYPKAVKATDSSALSTAEEEEVVVGSALATTAALSETTASAETAMEAAGALLESPEDPSFLSKDDLALKKKGDEKEGEEKEEVWPPVRRLVRPFDRFWTDEQRRRLELDVMLKQSNLPSSYDKAVAEARRQGAPPPLAPSPSGPYRDEVMTAVFECVAQMEPLLRGNGDQDTPFLWEGIWPQAPNGRPCFNPRGVYVVKLWAAGCWRAVVVNDQVPLNHKGECVLPATEEKGEIWPLILAKAAYHLLSLSPLGTCSGSTYAITHKHAQILASGGKVPQQQDGSSLDVSSLSAGGVFGFLVGAFTGWLSDAPASLMSLAATAKKKEDELGASGGGNGNGGGNESDAMEASKALVRRLLDDGVPCAPMEQFKHDEVFRAQVSQALSKDPFLVAQGRPKYPQPPEKLRGKHKKKQGTELVDMIDKAATKRDQRVREIHEKLFHHRDRARFIALCATEAPPLPEPEPAASPDQKSSRRRSSRGHQGSVMSGRSRQSVSGGSAAAATGGGSQGAMANNNGDGGGGNLLLAAAAEEDEEEGGGSGVSDEDFSSIGDATSVTGTVSLFDEFGQQKKIESKDEDDDDDEEAMDEGPKPIPASVQAALGATPPESSGRTLGSVASAIRSGIRLMTPPKNKTPLYPLTRVHCHVVLAVGLRASSRPPQPPLAESVDLARPLGGNGATRLSEQRLAWLQPLENNNHNKSSSNLGGDGSDDLALDDGASLGAGTVGRDSLEPPEPKLLVLWKEPGAYPSGAEPGELPDLNPDHPCMAKGLLKWLTPSQFIAAMGGSGQVSLVPVQTQTSMVTQRAAADGAASGGSRLVTLRHHWKGGQPPQPLPPTLLRIVAPAEEDEEDEVRNGGGASPSLLSKEAPQPIRVIVTIQADAPPGPPLSSSSNRGMMGADSTLTSLFANGSDTKSASSSAKNHSSSFGSLNLTPVAFLRPEVDDDDDDDEEFEEKDSEEDEASSALAKAKSEAESQKLKEAQTMAWVSQWRRPQLIQRNDEENDDLGQLGDSGGGSKGGFSEERQLTTSSSPLTAAPVGAYQPPMAGLPDGTVWLKLAPLHVQPNNTTSATSSLPWFTRTVELLLPPVPKQPRAMPNALVTSHKEFVRDYFLQLKLDLPHGGSVSVASSQPLHIGPAHEVWGQSLATVQDHERRREALAKIEEGKNEEVTAAAAAPAAAAKGGAKGKAPPAAAAAAAAEEGEGSAESNEEMAAWRHARSLTGAYPSLPSTVPPSMESVRDYRGRGAYDTRAQNWAVLFRCKVSVLPENGGGGAKNKGGEGDGEEEDAALAAAAQSSTLMDDVMGVSADVGCRLKLHLSDPQAARYVKLVTIATGPDGNLVPTTHPMLETAPLRWRSDAKQGYFVTAFLEKPPHVSLPPATWQLVALADAPLSALTPLDAPETPKDVASAEALYQEAKAMHAQFTAPLALAPLNEAMLVPDTRVVWRNTSMARLHRWSGTYSPNLDLKLLDDVLTSSNHSATPQTVTLRFEAFPPSKSPVPSYALKMRVYKQVSKQHSALEALKNFSGAVVPSLQARAGMEMVAQVRGLNSVLIEALPFSGASGLVVEVTLDEARMVMVPTLRSNQPYMSTVSHLLKDASPSSSIGALSASSSNITWTCLQWRFAVLPSNQAPLTLSPDPTAHDFCAKVLKKWDELRHGHPEKPLATSPFWLKATEGPLEERKQADAALRKRYKQHVDRLKKGKGKKPGYGAAATTSAHAQSGMLPFASSSEDGSSSSSSSSSGILTSTGMANRLYESQERGLMFMEDDLGVQKQLALQRAEHARLLEQQESSVQGLQEATVSVLKQWTATRESYRASQLAKVEAVKTLHEVATHARDLPEGQKPTASLKGALLGSKDAGAVDEGKGKKKK